MDLGVTGFKSKVVQEFLHLGRFKVQRLGSGIDPDVRIDRFLLCAGLLRSERLAEQSAASRAEGFHVNFERPVELCESILTANPRARICIIGSESGYSWSYDGVYAASKAALHRFVETRPLQPEQQLVCIAPGIIGDAGMTLRRTDKARLATREQAHPKRRFLTAREVAQMAHHLLFVDQGYTSGVVIRMNGGEHTCRP